MHIEVTFKNMEPSDALRGYVTKRLSKIGRFIDRPVDARVVLSVEKIRHKADVSLNADGIMINAVEVTEDLYSAIDMVMDKIERQVKRYKEKIQVRKSSVGLKNLAEKEGKAEHRPRRPRIVHEDYFIKPMNLEEATGQIELSDRDFIIFMNTETNRVTLIYKRDDGNLGLIEPII